MQVSCGEGGHTHNIAWKLNWVKLTSVVRELQAMTTDKLKSDAVFVEQLTGTADAAWSGTWLYAQEHLSKALPDVVVQQRHSLLKRRQSHRSITFLKSTTARQGLLLHWNAVGLAVEAQVDALTTVYRQFSLGEARRREKEKVSFNLVFPCTQTLTPCTACRGKPQTRLL